MPFFMSFMLHSFVHAAFIHASSHHRRWIPAKDKTFYPECVVDAIGSDSNPSGEDGPVMDGGDAGDGGGRKRRRSPALRR